MNSQATDWPADFDAIRDLNDRGKQHFGFWCRGLRVPLIHPGIFLPLIRRFCYMPAIEWASSVKAALGGPVSRVYPP